MIKCSGKKEDGTPCEFTSQEKFHFCPECGSGNIKEEPIVTTIKCPGKKKPCGAVLSSDSAGKFCTKCGWKIDGALFVVPLPRCPGEDEDGTPCGKEIQEGEQFCSNCGYEHFTDEEESKQVSDRNTQVDTTAGSQGSQVAGGRLQKSMSADGRQEESDQPANSSNSDHGQAVGKGVNVNLDNDDDLSREDPENRKPKETNGNPKPDTDIKETDTPVKAENDSTSSELQNSDIGGTVVKQNQTSDKVIHQDTAHPGGYTAENVPQQTNIEVSLKSQTSSSEHSCNTISPGNRRNVCSGETDNDASSLVQAQGDGNANKTSPDQDGQANSVPAIDRENTNLPLVLAPAEVNTNPLSVGVPANSNTPSTGGPDKDKTSPPSTGGHDKDNRNPPSIGGPNKDSTSPPSIGGHDKDNVSSPSTGGHDKDNTSPPSTGGHDKDNTSPPSIGGHVKDNISSPFTRAHDKDNTNPPSTGGHDKDNTSPPSTGGHDKDNTSPPSAGGPDKDNTSPPSTGGHDKDNTSPPSTGGHDKDNVSSPSTGGHDKDNTSPLHTGGPDKGNTSPPPTGGHDKDNTSPPSTGGPEKDNTSPPSTGGSPKGNTSSPSVGKPDKDKTNLSSAPEVDKKTSKENQSSTSQQNTVKGGSQSGEEEDTDESESDSDDYHRDENQKYANSVPQSSNLKQKDSQKNAQGDLPNEETSEKMNISEKTEGAKEGSQENENKETQKHSLSQTKGGEKQLEDSKAKKKKKKRRKKKKGSTQENKTDDGQKTSNTGINSWESDEKVEVVFHVVISEEFKLNPEVDEVFISFHNDHLGGWNGYKRWKMKWVRWENDLVLYSLSVPMSKRMRNNGFKYKYVVHTKDQHIRETVYVQQRIHNKNDDRFFYLPSEEQQNIDPLDRYDGFVYPKLTESILQRLFKGLRDAIQHKTAHEVKVATTLYLPTYDVVKTTLQNEPPGDCGTAWNLVKKIANVLSQMSQQVGHRSTRLTNKTFIEELSGVWMDQDGA